MYLITLFDAQSGDMDSVKCAESFDEALAWLTVHLGASERFTVKADCMPNHQGGKPARLARLEVEIDDVVIAVIEDSPPVCAVWGSEITDACNRLFDGDPAGVVALFRRSPRKDAG